MALRVLFGPLLFPPFGPFQTAGCLPISPGTQSSRRCSGLSPASSASPTALRCRSARACFGRRSVRVRSSTPPSCCGACCLRCLSCCSARFVVGRGGGREGPGGAGRRWFRPVVLAATVLAAIYVFWCSPGRSTLHIYIYIHLLVAARALCYLYVIYIYIASGASGAAVGVAAGSRAAVGAVGPGGPRHSAATSDQMRNLAVHPWSSFRTDCRSQGVAAGVAGCPHLACGACRRNVRGPGGTAGDATVRAVRRAICR